VAGALSPWLRHQSSRQGRTSTGPSSPPPRVIWLSLLPPAAIELLASPEYSPCLHSSVPPHRPIFAPMGGAQPVDGIWVHRRGPLSPLPSHAWAEVTHCQGPRRRNLAWKTTGPMWLYVAAGSGVALNVRLIRTLPLALHMLFAHAHADGYHAISRADSHAHPWPPVVIHARSRVSFASMALHAHPWHSMPVHDHDHQCHPLPSIPIHTHPHPSTPILLQIGRTLAFRSFESAATLLARAHCPPPVCERSSIHDNCTAALDPTPASLPGGRVWRFEAGSRRGSESHHIEMVSPPGRALPPPLGHTGGAWRPEEVDLASLDSVQILDR
jgi:hypothetical protein